MTLENSLTGCLLGTAVGDALGLPYERLSPRRARKMFGDLGRYNLLPGKGMFSDDTEHACLVAQCIIASGGEVAEFQRRLGWSLRWWLLGLPAGIGMATLKSCIKLWLGFPPSKSGIFSAGNGPAMRSPLLGVLYGDDIEKLRQYVRSSTVITHRDPKAFYGAMGAALAAFESSRTSQATPAGFLNRIEESFPEESAGEFISLIQKAARSAEQNEPISQFAESLGCKNGITGYIYRTVPGVIQTWLRYQDDFAGGVKEIISAGGDTDTTGAILGAIIGARVGKKGIPAPWLDNIWEWPRSVTWIEELAAALSEVMEGIEGVRCPDYWRIVILPRNLLFLLVVLLHGFRRMAPPY